MDQQNSVYYRHKSGTLVERLKVGIYNSWKNKMKRILVHEEVWEIVIGLFKKPENKDFDWVTNDRDPIPVMEGLENEDAVLELPEEERQIERRAIVERNANSLIEFEKALKEHNEHIDALKKEAEDRLADKLKYYQRKASKAALIIYSACSDLVQTYLNDIKDPAVMWETLKIRVDTALDTAGRLTLIESFTNLRPATGIPISEYFAKLLDLRQQLAGTDEALPTAIIKSHVFRHLPASFAVVIAIQRQLPGSTPLEVIFNNLIADEHQRSVENPDLIASGKALATSGPQNNNYNAGNGGNRGNRRGRGNRARGGYRNAPDGNKYCTPCDSKSHNTEDCWGPRKRPRSDDSPLPEAKREPTRSNPESGLICFHCAQPGHGTATCPIKKAGEEALKAFQS